MTSPALLVSCYELGRPPLGLAWPKAFLRDAGIDAASVDLAVEPFPDDQARAARVVAIAVPMLTALRIGVEAAARVRRVNPSAWVVFHGLYAWLNGEHLLAGPADAVLAGESEAALAALATAVLAGETDPEVPGVWTRTRRARPVVDRLRFPVPERSGQAPLGRYAAFVPPGGAAVPAAYTESSRGCLHTCRHCPVVPVYGGRFFVVPVETVLADVAQQVAAGARHVTFGDPDFLNGPGHAVAVARALHERFPEVGFDFTAKVEHLLRHRDRLGELVACGARFVVSAVESLSDRVLERLAKGHTARDVEVLLHVLDEVALPLQPTFVPFTPWTTLDDVVGLVDWIGRRGLQSHVPPVQMTIRLLVPPGSALLDGPDTASWLGERQPADFGWSWTHPDPRVDELHARLAARVEQAADADEPAAVTWSAVRRIVSEAAGRDLPGPGADEPMPPPFRPEPPRLTEHWFC